MAADETFDLIAVGGGVAGMVAANRAAELGLVACVLEKGKDDRYLCNSRFTGGTFHVSLRDIMSDAGELEAAIRADTEGGADPDLASLIAAEGRRVVRWLQEQGSKFVKGSPAAYHNWMLAPPRPARPGLEWQGRGGDVLLRMLGAKLAARGGKVLRDARARSLLMEGGRCAGVTVEVGGQTRTFAARAVVIADGGFQANHELLARYITPAPAGLMQRGAGTGGGDGLLMAQAAGAKIVESPNFYGHVLSRDAFDKPMLWPYPVLDSICAVGMVVDRAGRRIGDEGHSGVYTANLIARQSDPLGTFALFDAAIWKDTGKRDLIPLDPNLERGGATMLVAETLGGLAAKAGIDAAALERTVAAYNTAVQAGRLGELDPPRSSDKQRPSAIVQAPFYAVPLAAGITYTMGGIAVDTDARVLAAAGGAIDGLYAAGSAVGGVDGGPHAGYVGGLVKAGVLGLRAAEHAAESQHSSPAR